MERGFIILRMVSVLVAISGEEKVNVLTDTIQVVMPSEIAAI